SKDVDPATSGNYTVQQVAGETAITTPSVTTNPSTPGSTASYNISFTTSGSGALAAGDHIDLAGPVGTVFTFAASNYTVNGTTTSKSTAPAKVKDANGAAVSGASVKWSTNGDVTFTGSPCTTDAAGKCSATIVASRTVDQETITATVGSVTGKASLSENGPPSKGYWLVATDGGIF